MTGNWAIYGEESSFARKYVEAEQQKVNLLVCSGEKGEFSLIIEAGIESISVVLKNSTLDAACEEADDFAREYFRDKAKLFEEIADRL
ncbi:MAG: hypothetical protein LUE65_14525 [Clostridiales bacterium]|nr:hypothetical protein [Clostridiales bacterium]MCD8369723.1 hypothetical protein [Clostridiales bacterium]